MHFISLAATIGIALISLSQALGAKADESLAVGPQQQRIANPLPTEPGFWSNDVSGPLCGVYAACTAVELIGIKADPRDFIASRYVANCSGSSPEELAALVADAGAKAHIVTRLSAFDLGMMDCPVIANVRVTPASNRFNHWVVVIPSEKGMTIYDGLQKPFEVPTATFLGSWSGIGISVMQTESNPLIPIWLGRSSLLLALGIAGILVARNKVIARLANRSNAVAQICVLLVAATILSITGNAVFGDLLNHREGILVATASNEAQKYKNGTLVDAKQAAASPDTLLVDARMQQDYRLGTIEGAVNVPVTASVWAIRRYFDRVDRTTPIVVFCQSLGCEFDETIGTQLSSLGFSNVTVCNQGYLEYQQANAVASGL